MEPEVLLWIVHASIEPFPLAHQDCWAWVWLLPQMHIVLAILCDTKASTNSGADSLYRDPKINAKQQGVMIDATTSDSQDILHMLTRSFPRLVTSTDGKHNHDSGRQL